MMKLRSSFWALVVVLWSGFPLYWAAVTSVRNAGELFSSDLLPHSITFENYLTLWAESSFLKSVFNSLWVAGQTVLFSTLLSLLAAYPLARRDFYGKKMILFSFLFASMFPQITVLTGLFELIRFLGLFDQRMSLVLCYFIFTLPFNVWIYTSFMGKIPKSIEEAALLDGAGPFAIIFRIFVPIMAPSVVSATLLTFMLSWNEFLFALTFTPTEEARTAPVAIAMMSGASEYQIPWGMIMAASILVTAPVLVIVFLFQKKMVTGLTSGSVKA